MATATEGKRVQDVLRYELDHRYNRKRLTVLDGQVMTIGKVAKLNSAGKAVACAAAAVNAVQKVEFGAAATAGTLKIGVRVGHRYVNGQFIGGYVIWTDAISWSGTDATYLAAINAALDALLGSSKIVATAIAATDTDLGFVLTFSGTGYAGLPQPLVEVDASALTSVTTTTVTSTTDGSAVGGDATMVCLEDVSPVGADGKAMFLVRGPAMIDKAELTVPTNGLANVVSALEALNPPIFSLAEPTLTETVA